METRLTTTAARTPAVRGTIEAEFLRFLRLDAASGRVASDTLRAYTAGARYFLGWADAEGVDPATATPDDLRAYRRAMVEAGQAPATIAQRLTVARRLFAALTWTGARADNPAAGIRAPKSNTSPEDRIRFLTASALGELFAELPADLTGLRDRAMIGLMALHGLRGIEIHRADLADLDLGAEPPRLVAHGKSGRRTIYLRADVAAALRRYLEARQAAGIAAGPEAPLFVSTGNRGRGARLSRRGIRAATDSRLAAAGAGFTGTHVLRHTFATLARLGGAPMDRIQAVLGHADPRTTARYAHVVDLLTNNPAASIAVNL